jgi:hypothetical protein
MKPENGQNVKISYPLFRKLKEIPKFKWMMKIKYINMKFNELNLKVVQLLDSKVT